MRPDGSAVTLHSVDSFINSYLAALREENAAVFAGAGLSIPAGMVDWRGLLRGVAIDIGLDVDRGGRPTASRQGCAFHQGRRAGVCPSTWIGPSSFRSKN